MYTLEGEYECVRRHCVNLFLLRLAEVGKQVLKPIMKMLPAHSPAGGKQECSRQLGRSESEQWTVIQLPSSLPSTPTVGPGSTTIGPSTPTNTTIGFSSTTIGPSSTIAEEKPEHVISMPVSFTELPTPVGGFHRKLRLMRSNSDPDVMLSKRPPTEEAKSEVASGTCTAAEHQLTFELRSIEDSSGASMCRSLSHNDLILDDSCHEQQQQQEEEPSEASLETAAQKMEEVLSQSKSKRPLFSMFKHSRRKRVSSVTSQDDSADPRRRRKFLGRSRSLGPKKVKENRHKSHRSGIQSASNSIDKEEELPNSSSSSSCDQQRPTLDHADR